MVEICCELKEAARASSICWAEIPRAAARARSMATLTVGPARSMSLVTSWKPGVFASASISLPAVS